MRLCFVVQEYAGVTHPFTGGIGNWIAALAPALAARGAVIEVVVPRSHAEGPLPSPLERITFHPVARPAPGFGGDLAAHASFPRAVAERVEALAPLDIVVAQDFGGPAVAYAGRKHDALLVTHLHSSLPQVLEASEGQSRGRGSWLLERLQVRRERRQAERSDALAGCSTAVLRDTIRRWKLEPSETAVLPSLIDLKRTRALAAGALDPDREELAREGVVFVGRLYPAKGVETLTRAMRLLWEAGSRRPLVLAGPDGGWRGGTMGNRLRDLAGDFVDRLAFLGPVPPDELFPLVSAARVVALPSHWEAFPLAVVETMALGRPLVTTRGHGADDMVRPEVDALAVEPRDAKGLAAALDRLLRDPALAERLGAGAAERAEEYGLEPGARRFLEWYSERLSRCS